MAEKYHRWTNDDIATFWRLKEEGYTLDEIAEALGLSCASVRSKSKKLQKSSSVKTEQAGQNRTEPDSAPVNENDSGSLEFGSYDQMYCLIGQAGYLQQTAGFKVSRILIEADGDDWTITLSGAEKDGIPVELRMSRQKNPLPFRATMQNEQGRLREYLSTKSTNIITQGE